VLRDLSLGIVSILFLQDLVAFRSPAFRQDVSCRTVSIETVIGGKAPRLVSVVNVADKGCGPLIRVPTVVQIAVICPKVCRIFSYDVISHIIQSGQTVVGIGYHTVRSKGGGLRQVGIFSKMTSDSNISKMESIHTMLTNIILFQRYYCRIILVYTNPVIIIN